MTRRANWQLHDSSPESCIPLAYRESLVNERISCRQERANEYDYCDHVRVISHGFYIWLIILVLYLFTYLGEGGP